MFLQGANTAPLLLCRRCAGPLEDDHMNATTPHIPTCIAIDEVANPQDLWDLVIEGEAFPEDEPSQEA